MQTNSHLAPHLYPRPSALQIRSKIKELDAIIAATSEGPADTASAASRLQAVEAELADLSDKIDAAASAEDYDTAAELEEKADLLRTEQASLKKLVENSASNVESLLDITPAAAPRMTDSDPFASLEGASPSDPSGNDLDPFAGMDSTAQDSITTQPESDPFASLEASVPAPATDEVDPFAGVEEVTIPTEAGATGELEEPCKSTEGVREGGVWVYMCMSV